MNIIVTGSLGNIGRPLASLLLKQGHAVTVISSNSERETEIAGLGATAAIGSLEDPVFLQTVFTGADSVFLMVPPNHKVPDPREYYRKIGSSYITALQEAGVKRIVHLSSYGAHLDKGTGFILGSHDIEGMLNKLPGVTVTHMRPGYFYYNLYGFTEMIKHQHIMGANYGGDDMLVMVAPVDIATAAAEELTSSGEGGKVRYVVSDERSTNEIARVLGLAIDEPDLKWLTFSDEDTQKAMEQNGMPAHIAANMVELGASIHSGKLREDYDLNKPSEMGKVKLEDFAKEFAVFFKTT